MPSLIIVDNAEMLVIVVAIEAHWVDAPVHNEATAQDTAFCHDYHVMCPRLGSGS